MSVKFSNNTIKKLGTDLPTVYFDRIELFDDTFKIKLAVYVDGNADEQGVYDDYIKDVLSKLHYYIVLVMDGPVSPVWAPSNMPSPTVELTYGGTAPSSLFKNLSSMIEHYNILTTTTGDSAANWGLEPITSTGNSVVYGPATDGTMYTSVGQNYYTNDEIGQPSTNRIEKLISGQKTAFELIRRTGDYQIPGRVQQTPVDYFDLEQGASDSHTGVLPEMNTKTLYRPPWGTLTDEDGNYPEPVAWTFFSSDYEFVWSDPNLTDESIGFQCPYPPNASGGNTIKLSFDDFEDNYEIIYKPDGNVVYKHSITLENAFGETIKTTAGTETFEMWVTDIIKYIPKISMIAFSSILDVEIGPTAGNTAYVTNGMVTEDDPIDIAKAKLPIAKMNALMTSDVTYETITEYGKVVDKPLIVYIDSSGDEYEGTPIQTTDSLYHEETDITLGQVRQIFEDFSDSNRAAATRLDNTDPVANSGTADMENGLMFALNEYGSDPSLLVKLNQLRKNFPDTSSASDTGKLYQALKKKLFDVNSAVGRAGILMKRLARSAVVVDHRHTVFSSWVQPAHAVPYVYAGIYDPPTLADYVNCVTPQVGKFGDRYSPYGTADRTNPAYDQINIFINGFYFFDYEKAIQRESGLSKLIDVHRFESIFGRRITQSKFRLSKNEIKQNTLLSNDGADFYQYQAGTDGDIIRVSEEVSDIGIPSSRYHSGDAFPITTYPTADGQPPSAGGNQKATLYGTYTHKFTTFTEESKFMSTTSGDESGYNEGIPRSYVDVMEDITDSDRGTSGTEYRVPGFVSLEGENEFLGIDTGRSYSYTALRNFEFLENLKFDGEPYRLMAFEFQFVVPSQNLIADYDSTYQDYLAYEVHVIDTTTSIFDDLKENYLEMQNEYGKYMFQAQEFCSYNNLDGFFNDFFTNYQNNLYLSEPQNAPWIIAPLTYHLHLDLLTNEHNGDKLKILDEALKLTEKLNPETGTLSEVLSFAVDLQGLWTAYYDKNNDSSAAYEYNEMQSSARYNGAYTLQFGGNDGTSTPAGTYYPLPELNEVYYSPDLSYADTVTTTGEAIDIGQGASMVKMSFGMRNVPSNLSGNPRQGYRPIIPQIILSTQQRAIDQNSEWRDPHSGERLQFNVRKHNIDAAFQQTHTAMMMVTNFAGVDPRLFYQLASYSQQAVSPTTMNTVEVKSVDAGEKGGEYEFNLERVVTADDSTILQNKNWIRQGQWNSTSTSQNRAAPTTQYVSMYLFSGVSYSVTFRFSRDPLSFHDDISAVAVAAGFSDEASNYLSYTSFGSNDADIAAGTDYDADGERPSGTIWESRTYTFTVPHEVGQATTRASSGDGGPTGLLPPGITNIYLDCNSLSIDGGSVQGGTGELFTFASSDAWVTDDTVYDKTILDFDELYWLRSASGYPGLPILKGFPGTRTGWGATNVNYTGLSWSNQASYSQYIAANKL
jgi:hypothetical protein